MEQVLCKGVLDQDISSYNPLCHHQWGITLLTTSNSPSFGHAWNRLSGGICPEQALQFCFHWNIWAPAMLDKPDFAAMCPWKGFSFGVDVLSFKNQDFKAESSTIMPCLLVPPTLLKYINVFLIFNWKRSVLLLSLFNGEMTYRYFSVAMSLGIQMFLKSKG